jgi:hypothetical protein
MISSRFWTFSLLACCLGVCSPVGAQNVAPNAAKAWSQLDNADKQTLAIGLRAGLGAAPYLLTATWALRGENIQDRTELLRDYSERYVIQPPPLDQLVAGLNAFFGDYANQQLDMKDAIVIVYARIRGDDEATTNAILSKMRSSASKQH